MINEIGNTPKYQKLLGRLQARKNNKQEGDSDRDIENYAKKHWTDCKGKRVYGTDLEKSYNDGYDAEYYNIMKPRYDSICNSIEKYKQRKNESKNMNKKLIRLTESDLHKIVKESVNRIMEEYYPINSNDFTKDYRFAANGFANNSANMPSPEYDDIAPYSKNIGDYYAAPYRDSDQMYRDNVEFNRREHNKQAAADRRWMKAADSRPLYKKNSPNNDIPR